MSTDTTDSTKTAEPAAPEPQATGVFRTWRETSLAGKAILTGIVVNRFGAFMQLYLVLFLTHQGFSTVQAGFALGVYGAGAVVGVLVGGTLTDRLGSRRTILVSMSGTAAFILAVLYLTNYPALLVSILVVAAIGQAYRPASSTLLAELTPKPRYTMTFAMYRLSFNVGSMVAPLLGAALVVVSYSLLFWVEALAAIGYAAIAIVALPVRGGGRVKKNDGTDPRSTYLDVLRDRRFTLFLIAMMINALVYIQYISVLPLAMKAAGLATAWYGAMVALNGFIVITCELLITKATQRWPVRLIMLLGFLLLGGGRALYAIPWGLPIFIIGTLVWTLAEIIAGPTMFSYPPMAAPDRLRGRYIAASSAMFGVGTAVGPVIGLWLWSAVGAHTWYLLSLIEFAGLAAAMAGVRRSALAKVTAQVTAPVDGVPATPTPDRVRILVEPSLDLTRQLFQDRNALWQRIAANRDLPALTGRLLSIALPCLFVFGLPLGAGGLAQVLSSGIKLPLVFLVAALVCLPTLFMACRVIGVPLGAMQAAALIAVAMAISGVFAVALLPISLFFLLTTGALFFKVLTLVLLVLVAVAGVRVMAAGLAAVTTVPAAHNGLVDAPVRPNGSLRTVISANGSVDGPSLSSPAAEPMPPAKTIRRLVYAWGVLFGLVGSQLGWVLRPIFGAPDERFAVLKSIDGSFLGDLVHTISQMI
jgi:MFS family permease